MISSIHLGVAGHFTFFAYQHLSIVIPKKTETDSFQDGIYRWYRVSMIFTSQIPGFQLFGICQEGFLCFPAGFNVWLLRPKFRLCAKWLVVWVGGLEVWEVRVMCNINYTRYYIVLYSFVFVCLYCFVKNLISIYTCWFMYSD
jgi:hypothetical protein